ncbi:MAG: putative lipid II flippase FtsW [Magnetococcales bacterium]|nr:putative lipid II flippase FtsW [Magnetococcales bacterium]MBF0420904.1 putative lipid II flippase FtsW [Magnetococcales bacterium]
MGFKSLGRTSVKKKPPPNWEPSADKQRVGSMDLWVAGVAFALLIIGLVMVYSASAPIALRHFNNASYYALRNGIFSLVGLVCLAVISRQSMTTIRRLGQWGYWFVLFLLVITLIPGLGLEGGGARRWINIGFATLQPSEPFKVVLVVYMAHILALNPARVQSFMFGIIPLFFLFGIGAALMMAEPDFGSTVICTAVVFGIVFVAGIPLFWISALFIAAVPMAAAAVIMAPYRFRRVTSFLNPWDDPLNADFQLVQSLLSFGNGGFTGTGLGQGQQKQFYLPESHTDFIFSVIGEELGLFWILLIILLFGVLIWRALTIARLADDRFVRLASSGLAVLLGMQSVANMGVTMGLLPPKGLTLPLVSYGGTSIIVTLSAIGLLLAFSRTLPVTEKTSLFSWRKSSSTPTS